MYKCYVHQGPYSENDRLCRYRQSVAFAERRFAGSRRKSKVVAFSLDAGDSTLRKTNPSPLAIISDDGSKEISDVQAERYGLAAHLKHLSHL